MVLPTPGGPESNAALELIPSSLPPSLLAFAIKEDSRFYLYIYYQIICTSCKSLGTSTITGVLHLRIDMSVKKIHAHLHPKSIWGKAV